MLVAFVPEEVKKIRKSLPGKESHRETSSAREQGLMKGETFPN